MASQVDIANLALTLLGQEPIQQLDDTSAAKRAILYNWNMIRDNELAARHWRFAVQRVEVAALAAVPLGNEFTVKFQLPGDFLSPIRFGDYYPGLDLTDYVSAPTEEYSIEGNELLCNFAAPLLIVYVAKITNTALFHPCFNTALAAKIAEVCCEKITGNVSKLQDAKDTYRKAINTAMAANAILSPPKSRADNSWIMARVSG